MNGSLRDLRDVERVFIFRSQGQRNVNANVTPKYNLFGDYSVLFTLYNTGELSCNCGRRGGLRVSALDSGSSGPGSGPGQGH